MLKVVGIKFIDCGRIYYFDPGKNKIRIDDYVIVETERGLQYGQAVTDVVEMEEKNVFLPLKEVIRVANKVDKKTYERNKSDALKALEYAKKLVETEKIDMKLYEASYTFDKKKLIFKFIADERVDFRDLAKSLAAKYKTRIELRQIGVRDKAKEIGGLGPCGRSLCCTEFLTNFNSVSINMAKNQGIALNPTKINGACGRLLCCLGYEDDVYLEYKKNLPKVGQQVTYNGISAKVLELNILKKSYKIKLENDEIVEVMVNEDGSNK